MTENAHEQYGQRTESEDPDSGFIDHINTPESAERAARFYAANGLPDQTRSLLKCTQLHQADRLQILAISYDNQAVNVLNFGNLIANSGLAPDEAKDLYRQAHTLQVISSELRKVHQRLTEVGDNIAVRDAEHMLGDR